MKFIRPSVTDDDILNGMGDVALGVVTSHHYSASHNSPVNKRFVEAFMKANGGMRPNFMGVGGYDGMRVIHEAIKATRGAGGEPLLNAMKGQIFESPRGPMFIDAQTRDVVHNVYIRRVEKVKGELFNTEIETIADVKDSGKTR
jgi:branched-chain amino acid transport system substrate-binding protein